MLSDDSKESHSKKLKLAQSYELIVNKIFFHKSISCKIKFQILIFLRSMQFSGFTILQLIIACLSDI